MKPSSRLALSFLAVLSIATVPFSVRAMPAAEEVASTNLGTQTEVETRDRLRSVAPPNEGEPSALPNALPQVLLGHWVTNGGQTHYFFSENKVTVVNVLSDQVTAQPASIPSSEEPTPANSPQIYRQIMRYEVSFVNETDNLMYVQIETPLEWAERRWLRFSSDRRNVIETINILGHELSTEWTYVSNQQVPPTVLSYDF